MDEKQEQSYINGSKRAYISMLQHCCRELEYDDPEVQKASWIKEREETLNMLRNICAEYGDNDWPDDLYISDILEKHLFNHLHAFHNPRPVHLNGRD